MAIALALLAGQPFIEIGTASFNVTCRLHCGSARAATGGILWNGSVHGPSFADVAHAGESTECMQALMEAVGPSKCAPQASRQHSKQ